MHLVSEFAAVAGVSARTLRAWDEAGLFRPAWVDPATGYRWYTPAQLPELRRIVALRDLGLGLDAIRSLAADPGGTAAALLARRAALELERAEIDRRLAALGIEIGAAPGDAHDGGGRSAANGSAGAPFDAVLRPVPAQLVATVPLATFGGDDQAAFEALERHAEAHRRRARRPPGLLLGHGTLGAEAYVPLTSSVPAAGPIVTRRLAAARMATVLHHGSYDGLTGARRRLGRWIAATGLRPAGAARIVYLRFGADPGLRIPPGYVANDPAEYLTEIQQPVGPPGST